MLLLSKEIHTHRHFAILLLSIYNVLLNTRLSKVCAKLSCKGVLEMKELYLRSGRALMLKTFGIPGLIRLKAKYELSSIDFYSIIFQVFQIITFVLLACQCAHCVYFLLRATPLAGLLQSRRREALRWIQAMQNQLFCPSMPSSKD